MSEKMNARELNSSKNERWPLRVFAALIVLVASGVLIYYISFKGAVCEIELKKDYIQAGTKVDDFTALVRLNSSTPDIYKVEVVNTKKVNLSKPGKYKLVYLLTRNDGYSKKEKVALEVVDTKKPKVAKSSGTTYLGEDINLIECLGVTDNAEGKLTADVIDGKIDNEKQGDYKVKIKVKDESGNERIKKVIIAVRLSPEEYFKKIITANGGWVCADENVIYKFDIDKKEQKICEIISKNYFGRYEIKDITPSKDKDSYIIKMELKDYDFAKDKKPPADKKKQLKIKVELQGDKEIRASIARYINGSYENAQNVKKYSKAKLGEYYRKKGIGK